MNSVSPTLFVLSPLKHLGLKPPTKVKKLTVHMYVNNA